jgi:hypothetical protein
LRRLEHESARGHAHNHDPNGRLKQNLLGLAKLDKDSYAESRTEDREMSISPVRGGVHVDGQTCPKSHLHLHGFALFILIASSFVILRTPTDIFPSIDIPIISVAWTYTGLSPEAGAVEIPKPTLPVKAESPRTASLFDTSISTPSLATAETYEEELFPWKLKETTRLTSTPNWMRWLRIIAAAKDEMARLQHY